MRRIVVTGLGAYTPNGKNSEELFNNLKNGVSSIDYLPEDLREATQINVASYFKDYDVKDIFSKKELRSFDKVNQISVIAAREAAADAKLDQVEDRFRVGCNVTSGIGGLETIETEIAKAARNDNFGKISPMFIPKAIINLVAGNVAIDLNARGICNSVVTACASSTDAVGHAMMYIQNDMADVMIVGGSEATANLTGLSGFKNIGALSKNDDKDNACIPFDQDRNGFVMGEGAVCLILEELEHAKARGAHIYAEVVGYGSFCDASHITAPDPEGEACIRAIEVAMNKAQINPSDIDFINAHGTSTPLNDKSESSIFNKVFGSDVRVTSSKSMTGHMLGAAGAMEAFACIKGLEEGVITPTINTKNIDPEVNVKIVQETVNDDSMQYAMSSSLGFGGHNSIVIFKGGKNAKF